MWVFDGYATRVWPYPQKIRTEYGELRAAVTTCLCVWWTLEWASMRLCGLGIFRCSEALMARNEAENEQAVTGHEPSVVLLPMHRYAPCTATEPCF